jgi:hypothetical protein
MGGVSVNAHQVPACVRGSVPPHRDVMIFLLHSRSAVPAKTNVASMCSCACVRVRAYANRIAVENEAAHLHMCVALSCSVHTP